VDDYLRFTKEALPAEAPQDMFLHELRELIVESIVSGDDDTTRKLLLLLASGNEENPNTPLAVEARYLQALLSGNTAELQQVIPAMSEIIKAEPTMGNDMLRML